MTGCRWRRDPIRGEGASRGRQPWGRGTGTDTDVEKRGLGGGDFVRTCKCSGTNFKAQRGDRSSRLLSSVHRHLLTFSGRKVVLELEGKKVVPDLEVPPQDDHSRGTTQGGPVEGPPRTQGASPMAWGLELELPPPPSSELKVPPLPSSVVRQTGGR